MNELVKVECPYHHRLGAVLMDKSPKAVLHPCGCYLLITKIDGGVGIEVLPDNPPGDTPL